MYDSIELRKACCAHAQARAAGAHAGRPQRLGHRPAPRAVERARRRALPRARRRRAASSSTRWPTGAGPTSGTTSRRNDVPYNPLHDQFMPSIGCAPCTRAIAVGEDFRAGRWWWEDEKRQGMRPACAARRERRSLADRSAAMNAPHAIDRTAARLDHRHLDWLEEEAIFILREVGGRLRAPGPAVLRRQGFVRGAAPGREGLQDARRTAMSSRAACPSRCCTSTPATTSPR